MRASATEAQAAVTEKLREARDRIAARYADQPPVLEHLERLHAIVREGLARITAVGAPDAGEDAPAPADRIPARAYRFEPGTRELHDGWTHGRPPTIRSAQWPRNRERGLPLGHVATLRLPHDYLEICDGFGGMLLPDGEAQLDLANDVWVAP